MWVKPPPPPQVQIRPWRLSDSDFIMDHTQPIDARKTIFIGGVPRPLKACELADIFNARYGNVCYAGIDCDPDLKYPKGENLHLCFSLSLSLSFYYPSFVMSAVLCCNISLQCAGAGRVTFSSRVSFMSAVSCRFLQVTYGDIDKKVTKMCMYSPLVSSLPINYSHAVSTRSFSHVVQWKFSQSETWEAFLLACGSLYLCYLLHAVSLHVTGRQLTNLFVPKEPMLFQPVHPFSLSLPSFTPSLLLHTLPKLTGGGQAVRVRRPDL